jgi:hypothetical protein
MPKHTEAHIAYGTVKTFFYEHNICSVTNKTILNLELEVSSETKGFN